MWPVHIHIRHRVPAVLGEFLPQVGTKKKKILGTCLYFDLSKHAKKGIVVQMVLETVNSPGIKFQFLIES